MKRKIMAEIEIDDEDCSGGVIPYLENEFGWLEQSGFRLISASIAQEDNEQPIIFTHDEASLIVDIFEDELMKNNIRVPSPEDYERDRHDCGLYGSVYSKILDAVEGRLISILRQRDCGSAVVTNQFSGTV